MTRGDEARSAIVEAAERLFAEQGLHAVSLREVSSAAGQRNNVAAQYHFGDRAGLVAAVYAARMGPVNERRLRRISAFEERRAGARPAEPVAEPVPELVALIVEPLADVVLGQRTWYARFLARALWDPLAEAVLAEHPAASSLRLLAPRWREALPQLSPELRRSRVDQLGALVIGTLAGWEWARDRDAPRLGPTMLVADLVATGAALLTTPAPEGSLRLPADRPAADAAGPLDAAPLPDTDPSAVPSAETQE